MGEQTLIPTEAGCGLLTDVTVLSVRKSHCLVVRSLAPHSFSLSITPHLSSISAFFFCSCHFHVDVTQAACQLILIPAVGRSVGGDALDGRPAATRGTLRSCRELLPLSYGYCTRPLRSYTGTGNSNASTRIPKAVFPPPWLQRSLRSHCAALISDSSVTQ